MPNYYEGTPRDPKVRKQIEKIYRGSSAPESNTDAATRSKLEQTFRTEPSQRPNPIINQQSFKENLHSATRPKGFEDIAAKARESARAEITLINEQAKISINSPRGKATESPTNTPRPATPAAGTASTIATLGIGYLVDRYVTPYLMDKAQRAGDYIAAELYYKAGKISEFELSQALETIRNGNSLEWGNRIKEIRRIQEAAKKGVKHNTSKELLPGQTPDIVYRVGVAYKNYQDVGGYAPGSEFGIYEMTGPIGSFVNLNNVNYFSDGTAHNVGGIAIVHGNNELFQTSYSGAVEKNLPFITRIERVDGKPDTGLNSQQNKQKAPIVTTTIRATYITNNYQTPPITDKIPEINKAKPNTILVPAGLPIGVSGSNKTIEIIPSKTSPSKVEIPHPRTIPADPNDEKKVPPLSITNSNSPNIKLETPGSGPVTINIPGYNPITVNPGTNKPQGALPIQDTTRQYTPVTSPTTTPTPTPTPTTTKPATTDDFEKFKKDLEKLLLGGTILAALTPTIQGMGDKVNKISENTTPQAIKAASKAGTCESFNPGECNADIRNNARDAANNSGGLLNALGNLASIADLALLKPIYDTVTATASGLNKFYDWAHLDRVLNILTFVNTTHNAYMLSNGLTQTLFSMVSNVLAAVGIKDKEGSPLDINSIVGKTVENLFKSVLGVETVDGIKAEWKKYNRIYQAAANLMWSLQSIGNSMLSAAEVIGERVALIGNALVKWRVVSEKAYNWMNPQANFQNRFFTTLESTQNVVSQVDSVASEVLSIESTITQIGTQKKELTDSLAQLDNSKQKTPQPEATKIKAEAAASTQASLNPPTLATADRNSASE
jgi:hypothetical protein